MVTSLFPPGTPAIFAAAVVVALRASAPVRRVVERRRIQWVDVLLVVLGVIILLMLTYELWMPHNPPGRE